MRYDEVVAAAPPAMGTQFWMATIIFIATYCLIATDKIHKTIAVRLAQILYSSIAEASCDGWPLIMNQPPGLRDAVSRRLIHCISAVNIKVAEKAPNGPFY